MTLKLFFEAVFCFFAILGFLSLAENIIRRFFIPPEPEDMYVVLTVKNQQDSVEAMLRSIVWQNLHSKNGGRIPQIVVVDMGSSDDTFSILKRLADDFNFIHITDKEGYLDWIKKMVS